MRSSTPELRALLDSNQFVRCKLYTLTLMSSSQYRWTDADIDVLVRTSGIVFSSLGPSISGMKYSLARGLAIDELDLTVLNKTSDLVDGVEWNVAARAGALDGADLKVDQAFLPAWGRPAETVEGIFTGYVSYPVLLEVGVTLHVVSDADKLNTQIPRLDYQPTCMRTLYSTGCTVSKAAYRVSGSVSTAPDLVTFTTPLTQPDGYFSLGYVDFTSGQNSGVRRSIKNFSHSAGTVELSFPLSFDLAPGDTFLILPGCDHSDGSNGCEKFDNVSNFKAMKFLPRPESIMS